MLERISEKFPEDAPFISSLSIRQNRLDNLRVYADWLEESNAPIRARIVRLHIQMANLVQESQQYLDKVDDRNELLKLLNERFPLAKQWLALIGFGPIEICFSATNHHGPCSQRWENMPPIEGDATKRLCHYCNMLVNYCDSIETATHYVSRGELVTVDPRVLRRRHDLGQIRHG
ncbi:MAG: hypothetical protein P8J27_05420 [Mariniblastus sp.]|nr:hypothetical protein [Mariniblastus sp.]